MCRTMFDSKNLFKSISLIEGRYLPARCDASSEYGFLKKA